LPPSSLELLRRTEKWYLGSGDGLVWAPPFPAWHDVPGFWDEAHLGQYPVGPLFTISFLLDGQVVPLPRSRDRSWTPADFTLEYELGSRVRGKEVRSAPGERELGSEWELINRGQGQRAVDVVLWTAVNGESVEANGVSGGAGGIRLTRKVRDRKEQEIRLHLDFSLSGATSWAAYRSEGSGSIPDFSLTPFFDRWDPSGRLPNAARLDGINPRGLVYVGLVRRVRLGGAKRVRFVASVQLTPADLSLPPSRPGATRSLRSRSREQWGRFEREVPRFTCSDERITRYWWYRWYGLRLNAVPAGLGQYQRRSVCEGIGYFHQPISYSAMCHAREVRWSSDAEWAYGVAGTFFSRLGADGSMPGRVYLDHLQETDFYHSDWGGALEDVYAVHPDPGEIRALFPQVAKYAEWLGRTRDREGSGMIDVIDQYETGQEYMSRYQAVDPLADQYGWENRLRLKGIDVTVYAYRLYRFLERFAPDPAARSRWRVRADAVRSAVRERMWDPSLQMFFDLDPVTGRRTGVKAAVCFYPYLTDLAGSEHVEGLGRHLFDPGEFWTPFPVPSSSRDDALFSPDAEWKGKRHVCPWNGRVWPMTNSHVIDGLARVARLHRPDWTSRVVELIRRFITMLSFDGDPASPNCFEHYHPLNGRGSLYRGIDDYQHSWVNDLIVRHLAGIHPRGEAGVTVDPLPFGVTASMTNVRISGHDVSVRIAPASYTVRVDGKAAGRGRIGQAREISW
jgi:hypothetical protein